MSSHQNIQRLRDLGLLGLLDLAPAPPPLYSDRSLGSVNLVRRPIYVCALVGCGNPTFNGGGVCGSVHCGARTNGRKSGDLKYRGAAFACACCPNPVKMPGQLCERLDCTASRSMQSGSASRARSSSSAWNRSSGGAGNRSSSRPRSSSRTRNSDEALYCKYCRMPAEGSYGNGRRHKICYTCRETKICNCCWRKPMTGRDKMCPTCHWDSRCRR